MEQISSEVSVKTAAIGTTRTKPVTKNTKQVTLSTGGAATTPAIAVQDARVSPTLCEATDRYRLARPLLQI